MSRIKTFIAHEKRRLILAGVPVATAMMAVVPAFASPAAAIAADGTIDPTLFDPLITGITSNIGAVMPKLLVVVAILIGIGAVLMLVKKHARPS